MNTVFITGGAGFIGSHLTDAYLAAGSKVIVLDNLSTGSLENLRRAQTSPNFEFIEGDLAEEGLVSQAVRRSDLVVHLAARIGLKLVIESPLKTLEANVKGTEVVLACATHARVRTIITSTSEVYGLTVKFPSHEDDPITFGSPKNGRWSYACSKAYDEFLALALFAERGLPVTVVRLFNTVGPRQSARYGMVLPRFVRQALAGEPLTVYGDGSQTRCFGYVADVVWALQKLAAEPRALGEIFNLGNPEEISILDLAHRVLERTQSPSPIEHVPFTSAYGQGFQEIVKRVPDIGKIARLTGFAPHATIDQIIDSVLASQRAGLRTAGVQ
ncbi:MAG: GDP-mannose 4,6-dehydratase [Candidatus Eremiobacteraeota bacterium]|nr:GDP-mannose 4,6-dehydratase [Candidatus Eremiobacteraeota bacterium]